jgi:DNA repair protein RadC
MQEAFFCVYLDRKNHPLGRHLITLGTAICADSSR